ncbi:MAG: spore maturation protein [Ruminococcaceae bacterium]|nr:spore maturation protein [Oscillospiraceae bacterium]
MTFFLGITKYIMPLLLLLFAFVFIFSKNNPIDSFIKGAKEGALCCYNLLPSLLLIMCGVSALFSSGAVDLACDALSPVLDFLGVPQEMLSTIVLRPFSGSAVTAVADKMFNQYGADSDASKIACLLMGSTDTIIYTLSMYFSAVNIKRTRYALPASLLVFIFSVFVCVTVGNHML